MIPASYAFDPPCINVTANLCRFLRSSLHMRETLLLSLSRRSDRHFTLFPFHCVRFHWYFTVYYPVANTYEPPITISQTSAAVVMPRPSYRFPCGLQAPPRIAPVKARPTVATPTSGDGGNDVTASSATVQHAQQPSGGDSGSKTGSFEDRHSRWQHAMVKYIKRRIMATRFRLNQEAYRMRLKGGAKKIEADREASARVKVASMAFKSNLIRYRSCAVDVLMMFPHLCAHSCSLTYW